MEINLVFSKLLSDYGMKSQAISNLWEELSSNYSGKKRHYHNLNHLSDLYTQLLPLQPKIKNWNVILFTLFYHDAIYKSTRKDNEEKSAELAAQRMKEVGVPQVEIDTCINQIIATKAHVKSTDSDTNYFTDADLSILGRDWETYETYCKNIRREYAIYPSFMYKNGRKKVIKHFLSMDQIFKTEEFYDAFEHHAISNLNQELKLL